MQGSGKNLKDHITKTVAYYGKRSLDPQLAELAAYRRITAENKGRLIRIYTCEGCKIPYNIDDQNNVGLCYCGQCTTIVKCQCTTEPPMCLSCSRYQCIRHASMLQYVACCYSLVCRSCVTSCCGCANDICHNCVYSADSTGDDLLEYCEGCSK